MVYIKTILALIPLLIKLVDWIKEASKEDPAKFLTDLDEAIDDVKHKKDPAKIQALIKRL
jgi:hypothetical protein